MPAKTGASPTRSITSIIRIGTLSLSALELPGFWAQPHKPEFPPTPTNGGRGRGRCPRRLPLFQGSPFRRAFFPGRCPGLRDFAPMGLGLGGGFGLGCHWHGRHRHLNSPNFLNLSITPITSKPQRGAIPKHRAEPYVGEENLKMSPERAVYGAGPVCGAATPTVTPLN